MSANRAHQKSLRLKHTLNIILLLVLLIATPAAPPAVVVSAEEHGVQAFLDDQPGPLKHFSEDGRSAATIIESAGLYYGLSPRLHLALLEAVHSLLSDPNPPDTALRRPFGPNGPDGFAEQIEWASRELRAGLGPYDAPPVVRFSDGVSLTLSLDQAPEGVAVQRFLAHGRRQDEWQRTVERFNRAFQVYFNNELIQPFNPPAAVPVVSDGFLLQPWPAGTRVVHLAYFDHVYPTVDSGSSGNGFVVNYLNQGQVQYDGHDGHDYYFPDQPVGTPILAAAAGTAFARTHRGNGVVIVHPNGYETVYWHLDSFAPIFAGRIDTNEGLPVAAGTFLGTSGSSGFVQGNPHLHFEVRRYGKVTDPYGWQGPGVDPCILYAGCIASEWLWDSALNGTYDFNPPTSTAPAPAGDTTAPIGTLTVNPPNDLRLAVDFDGHTVQQIGYGFAELAVPPAFEAGHTGEALRIVADGLAYPTTGNIHPATGTISLWVRLPETYPPTSIDRHYLFAASANPDGAPVYSGTLALRRDLLGPGGTAQWTFWSNAATAESRHLLSVPDTLEPGWHHFAISWHTESGTKTLFINGEPVATADGVTLPHELGEQIQIGRFTYGGVPFGGAVDQLRIYSRALPATTINTLFLSQPDPSTPVRVDERRVRLDTNAVDNAGAIVAVQLGIDGSFAEPQPYHDNYRWLLPEREQNYALSVRYVDRSGNQTIVTRTVQLDLPPTGTARITSHDQAGAILEIAANDRDQPIMMQISQRIDFADADWQPYRTQLYWAWEPDRPTRVYVRLRDATGRIAPPLALTIEQYGLHLPLLMR
jgi:murein DD-endopeptidase MepM/ murein hydrolase activator NlpD